MFFFFLQSDVLSLPLFNESHETPHNDVGNVRSTESAQSPSRRVQPSGKPSSTAPVSIDRVKQEKDKEDEK